MPNFTSGTSTSLFVAARNASSNTGWNVIATVFFNPVSLASTRFHFSFNQEGVATGITLFTNAFVGQVTSTPISTSANAIVGFTASSTSSTIHVNGNTSTYSGVSLSNPNSVTEFVLNDARNSSSTSSDIMIFEVIGFNSQLSASERQLIEGYLASKWGLQPGLPSTHPFKRITP